MSARHERGTRRHALRRGGEHAVKLDPFRGQTVKVRRLHLLASVAMQVRVAVIIREDEEDVRQLFSLRMKRETAEEEYEGAEKTNHGVMKSCPINAPAQPVLQAPSIPPPVCLPAVPARRWSLLQIQHTIQGLKARNVQST